MYVCLSSSCQHVHQVLTVLLYTTIAYCLLLYDVVLQPKFCDSWRILPVFYVCLSNVINHHDFSLLSLCRFDRLADKFPNVPVSMVVVSPCLKYCISSITHAQPCFQPRVIVASQYERNLDRRNFFEKMGAFEKVRGGYCYTYIYFPYFEFIAKGSCLQQIRPTNR